MLTIGQSLQERYQITAKLGEGGMGAVYRAYDNRLNKECVVKEMLITPEMMVNTGAAAEQFKREASVLATLRHPGLPVVGDYFIDHGNNYLVMDFVEGQNLHHLIGAQGLPEATVLDYAKQLLDVLEYIHSKGVVHRDIKPANIVVKSDGRVVLVDFGLVKMMTLGSAGTNTFLRGVGTPEYAPPEQMKGGTDQRSDVYSLGATLYHALTGRPPLDATDRSMTEMLTIRQRNPAVSARTERVVMQALMMQPTKRWQSAADMHAELGSAQKATVPTRKPRISKTVVIPHGMEVPPEAPATSAGSSRGQRQQRMLISGVVGSALLIIVALLVLRGASVEGISGTIISTSTRMPQPVAARSTRILTPTATFVSSKTPTVPSTVLPTSQTSATPMLMRSTEIPTQSVSTGIVTPTVTIELARHCAIGVDSRFLSLWEHAGGFVAGCPQGQANIKTFGYQLFENGYMLWMKGAGNGSNLIYVIYNNGTWQAYRDGWTSDMTYSGNLIPPRGMVEPSQGFGYVWRTKLGGVDSTLGWALASGDGADGLAQSFGGKSIIFTYREFTVFLMESGKWFR